MNENTISSELHRQRLRVSYGKGAALKYISHLDLARAWERLFRRARLPLVYSQGFSPHPRFALGAALPVGVIGSAEVMDIWLATPLPPEEVAARLAAQSPPGLKINCASEVDAGLPSLQAAMRWADYRVILDPERTPEDLAQRVAQLLAATSAPRERMHKGKLRAYDLRPLIASLELSGGSLLCRGRSESCPCIDNPYELTMRLATSSEATARVDEALAALGLQEAAVTVERTRLIWDEEAKEKDEEALGALADNLSEGE
jgi:radical SAM-linked protein